LNLGRRQIVTVPRPLRKIKKLAPFFWTRGGYGCRRQQGSSSCIFEIATIAAFAGFPWFSKSPGSTQKALSDCFLGRPALFVDIIEKTNDFPDGLLLVLNAINSSTQYSLMLRPRAKLWFIRIFGDTAEFRQEPLICW
jgi:hypothetical protein